MKKIRLPLGIVICLFLVSCSNNNTSKFLSQNAVISLPKTPTWGDSKNLSYPKSYTDFLLSMDQSENDDGFPVSGYYLLDLNFDNIPELGVHHDSGGSMGGYFNFYCFDGNQTTAVLDSQNEPARISDSTQILADMEHKKLYLLKEMYLLVGNENGTYGYVRDIIDHDNLPYVNDILRLDVNQEMNLLQYDTDYYSEDDYLSDAELTDCLVTQYDAGSGWSDILPTEYLKLKRELIPAKNSFVDLRNTDAVFLVSEDDKITAEDIDALLLKWEQSLIN